MVLRSLARGCVLGVLASSPAFAQETPSAAPETPPPAAPAAPTVDVAALEARLQEVDQRSRILERKLEIAEEENAKRIKQSPVVVAGDKGFSITSADKAYQIRLRGLLQADTRWFFNDDRLSVRDTFAIRKARSYLDASLGKFADFRIMADFVSTSAPIQDAYADLKPSTAFKLRVGKFKSPVSLERLKNDAYLKFAERAFPSSIAPNRDVGVQAHGDLAEGVISYAVGVFNGAPDGGSVDVDASFAKDFAGRIFFLPFKLDPHSALANLGFGVGASTGNQKGSPTATGLSSYVTSGTQTYFNYFTDSKDPTTNVFAVRRRSRLDPQLYWYAGSFGLLSEYIIEKQTLEKKGVRKDFINKAFVVEASYILTGEDNGLEGPNVREPLDPTKGTWGSFELAARYHELEVDEELFAAGFADPNTSAQKASAIGGALIWSWNRNVLVTFNYEVTKFKGGAANKQDRKTEHLRLARAQINF
jgi:phosphate-selective porin OprO and OprP